jgi:hypothetical protein
MAWDETSSMHFTARHDARDRDGAADVLALLETTRARLLEHFPVVLGHVEVGLHGSPGQLDAAQPLVVALRAATAPAARRYVVGWTGRDVIHVLAPRVLESRASAVPESRRMLLLSPAALLAQLVAGVANPRLQRALLPMRRRRAARWAWLAAGAGQYFSGQWAHARPAIARRLREGRPPSFPPALRDAAILGGSVLDLLAREEGVLAAVRFTVAPPSDDPRDALIAAFHGRSLVHTEGTWRAHLARSSLPGS